MGTLLTIYLVGVVINSVLAAIYRNAYTHDDITTKMTVALMVALSFMTWVITLVSMIADRLKDDFDGR